MKKAILTIVGGVFMLMQINAQVTQVEKGNLIIDPYVGFPNWSNSLIFNNYNGDDSENVKDYKVNGGLLSYGARIEYMVADKFGLGLDVNYEVSGFNYNGLDTTETAPLGYYNHDYKSKKLRAMLRFNHHLVQNDRVDFYYSIGAGYKHVNRKYETNDPYYSSAEYDGAIIPFSFRAALGTRIYFTKNIGMHMEIGAFGGSIFQVGLSAKL